MEEINDGCKLSPLSIRYATESLTGGESDYNEGKGISITLHFTALVPKKAGQTKRRKNAAAPKAISKVLFVHEDMPFHEFLTKIIVTIKRKDLFEDMQVQDGEITNTPFDLRYTIARTSCKNIELQTMDDFATMMAEARTKTRAAIVLAMIEKKVFYISLINYLYIHCLDRHRLPGRTLRRLMKTTRRKCQQRRSRKGRQSKNSPRIR